MSLLSMLAVLAVQQPQSSVETVKQAIAAGRVGERYDGFLDFVDPPGERLRKAVGAINIRRRALYNELGSRRNVTPSQVGVVSGCKLLLRVPENGAYLLDDGTWRTRSAETPLALPDYCAKLSR